MPPTKRKGGACEANRRREQEESESDSEDSEEDESSSEESESGESEVSIAKPGYQFDSDDSRNMSEDEKTNKRSSLRRKGPNKAASIAAQEDDERRKSPSKAASKAARKAAPDDDDELGYVDIHKDDPTYKDDERVLVSEHYIADLMKHAKLLASENKELLKSIREYKKDLRLLRRESRDTVHRGRKSILKNRKMSQADHANMTRVKEVVRLDVWPSVKRLQKKDLVYSVTEGTVCHIVLSSGAIQWSDSCDGEEDRQWYYDTHVMPWINVAMQELLSANNDATREQYKCE